MKRQTIKRTTGQKNNKTRRQTNKLSPKPYQLIRDSKHHNTITPMIFSLIYFKRSLIHERLSAWLSIRLSVYLSVCLLSVCLSVCVFVCLLACLSSASLPVGLCVFLFSCLFACLCVCMSVRLLSACLPFVFLSVCVSVIYSWEVISTYKKT